MSKVTIEKVDNGYTTEGDKGIVWGKADSKWKRVFPDFEGLIDDLREIFNEPEDKS